MRGRLVAYGHSWVAGDGATRPERRLVDVAALRMGLTPVNLGIGGSSSGQTADLVRREGAAPADAYLIVTGLNDARLHGGDPAALEAYAGALDVVVGGCAATSPESVTLVVRQPPLTTTADTHLTTVVRPLRSRRTTTGSRRSPPATPGRSSSRSPVGTRRRCWPTTRSTPTTSGTPPSAGRWRTPITPRASAGRARSTTEAWPPGLRRSRGSSTPPSHWRALPAGSVPRARAPRPPGPSAAEPATGGS